MRTPSLKTGWCTAGGGLYTKTCAICHGIVAISGGVLPDLRHSPMIASANAFNNIVIGGALQEKGMVSFAEVLSEEDAEAIRAYVVYTANQTAAPQQGN
jgi:mono/diheme cytochrome c family protein